MCQGCDCYGLPTTPKFTKGSIIDHDLWGRGWIMKVYGGGTSVLAVFKDAQPTGQVVHACEFEVLSTPAPQA